MSRELVRFPHRDLSRAGIDRLPAAIGRAGEQAAWRFVEFFGATIRNRNTRVVYAQAINQVFAWFLIFSRLASMKFSLTADFSIP